MSSRIIAAADGAGAEPLVFRAAAPERDVEVPSEPAPVPAEAPAPDFAAELERERAEWRQEAARRVAEARDAGYREGEAAGRRAAEAGIAPIIERLARSAAEIANLRPLAMARAEADLLKLALAIARRVLHRELSIDPQAVEGLVKVALERVRVEEVRRVRVDPAQAAALQAALGRLTGGAGIEVRADGQLAGGGVVLETGRGNLDASVDTQLAEIERGLTDKLEGRA